MNEDRLVTQATVASPQGLHLRVASQFARSAAQFACQIEVVKGGLRVNGKGAMHLMMLAAEHGAQLTLEASGPDAADALAALKALLETPPAEDLSLGS